MLEKEFSLALWKKNTKSSRTI